MRITLLLSYDDTRLTDDSHKSVEIRENNPLLIVIREDWRLGHFDICRSFQNLPSERNCVRIIFKEYRQIPMNHLLASFIDVSIITTVENPSVAIKN